MHADATGLEVASGLESTKCVEAYGRIREIVEDLANRGPSDEEVERARAYAAGSAVLALEGTNAVARRAADRKVTHGEVAAPDDAIAALDAVTSPEVHDVAREVAGAPAVACVGPHVEADFR